MSDLWFPEADRSRPAPEDGGSIATGKPKCLWHDTETSGLPSYSNGFFPHMTIHQDTAYQHIPANRAARALRNPSGGVQTNRANVFQIEVCGFANKVEFAPVMAEVAFWLETERGIPRHRAYLGDAFRLLRVGDQSGPLFDPHDPTSVQGVAMKVDALRDDMRQVAAQLDRIEATLGTGR